jgi:hypothetical protein
MPSLFGLTPQDLLAKLVPAPGAEGYAFSIGPNGPPENDLSDADAMKIIEEQEAIVESYLRHKYQRLLRHVEGEIAVRYAYEGQLTCKATLTPITAMYIYKNWPRTRAWCDRRPSEAMDPSEYSVNFSTGIITFTTPLRENDQIYLDYYHEGASKLVDLRHLVLSLAAVEVARRFAYFRSAEGFDRFEGWQSSAAGHLRDLGRTDGAQIGLFDRIELVNETKNLNLGAL